MQYKLETLLDMFRTDDAVALYLTEGFAPVFAISGRCSQARLPAHCLPSALLFPAEGAALSREDLLELLDDIKRSSTGSGSGYRGLEELRFQRDGRAFDVYMFSTDAKTFIEFRLPDVTRA